MNWLSVNSDWLFSGAGVTIVIGFFAFVLKLKDKFISNKRGKLCTPPSISINIEKALIRHYGNRQYFIQINGYITAKNRSIQIKSVRLKADHAQLFDSENQGEPYTRDGMHFAKLLPYESANFLSLPLPKLDEALKKKYADAKPKPIRDCLIENGQTLSFSVLEQLWPPRLQDGWERMSLCQWKIVVECYDNIVGNYIFSFSVDQESETECREWIYSGFKQIVSKGTFK